MVEIKTRMLKGSVVVPPSKSAAHRAIISAALTRGKCTIKNIQMSNDIVATCGCLEQLGAVFEYNEKKGTLKVNAQGLFKNMDELELELDCGESGSTLRFSNRALVGQKGKIYRTRQTYAASAKALLRYV